MSDACCKVGRVARDHELDGAVPGGDVDDALVSRWLGRGDYSATGLRPLADWFNTQLLRRAFLGRGRSATETRLRSEYEALRGDDDLARAEVVDDLRGDAIDGEALAADFVSKSSLQRHLTDCLGVEKDTGGRSERDWEAERVDYVRGVVRDSVAGALRSLENRGDLPGATAADVELRVDLRCPECGTRVPFEAARERGFVCEAHLGAAGDDDPGG